MKTYILLFLLTVCSNAYSMTCENVMESVFSENYTTYDRSDFINRTVEVFKVEEEYMDELIVNSITHANDDYFIEGGYEELIEFINEEGVEFYMVTQYRGAVVSILLVSTYDCSILEHYGVFSE